MHGLTSPQEVFGSVVKEHIFWVFPPIRLKPRFQKSPIGKTNETEKKKHYNNRVIEVEHGSFTPLVFATLGGCRREAEIFLKKLSEQSNELAET